MLHDNSAEPTIAFLVTINTATGAVANRGQTVERLDAIAFDVRTAASSVPVVSTLGLLILGGLLLLTGLVGAVGLKSAGGRLGR